MFKIGDKIICIDCKPHNPNLTLNQIYVVKHIAHNRWLRIDEDGFYWLSTRFKKIDYSKSNIMFFINKLESKLL